MNTQPQRHREHGDYTEKSKLRHYRRSDHNLLLREPDPGSDLATDTVRKIAEVVACQVILEVSRIEVICHIEHLKSQMRSVLVEATWEIDSLQHLHIKRNECRKATGTISWADEVAIFIDEREREPGSYIEDGRPR